MSRKFDELTSKQQDYLTALFGEAKGVHKDALRIAGYSETSGPDVVRSLKAEIIDLAEQILAKGAPVAAFTLIDAAAGEGEFISNIRLDAAKQVLDRIGLGRKERMDLKVDSPNGIFILPSKEKGSF
jgi:hypothetical protein